MSYSQRQSMLRLVVGCVFPFMVTASAALQLLRAVTAVSVTPGWEVAATAVVFNESALPVRVLVEMDTTAVPVGSIPYFCWGPSCYAPGVLLSLDTVTIASGAQEESFKAYVFVEQGTAPATFPLRFRFRDALSRATMLEHVVRVQILPVGTDSLFLPWAQTELFSREEGEISSSAALYNASSSPRYVLVRADPTGIPPSSLRLCLGDSCYAPGTLTAPDTLVLSARQLYPRFRCWLHIPDGAGGAVSIHFLDAFTASTVATYSVRVDYPTVMPELALLPPCAPLPSWVHGEAVTVQAQPGSVLELSSLLGQHVLRYAILASTPQRLSLRNLPPGLYLYRLFHPGAGVCTGVVLRVN